MRRITRQLDDEPRTRPARKRKAGRKRYVIEYRWGPRTWARRAWGNKWVTWKRYFTKKDRDKALHDLQNKGPSIGEPLFEYRKGADG